MEDHWPGRLRPWNNRGSAKRGSHAVLRRSGHARRRRPPHGDADLAARPRRGQVPRPPARPDATPSGNELRQTGEPRGAAAGPGGLLRSAAGAPRLGGVPGRPRRPRSCSARTSPPPAGSSPRTGPGPWTSSGFGSQLIFNTFHNGRLHDLEHAGDVDARLRRGPGPQPRECSSSARSTPASSRPATSPWSIPDRAIEATERGTGPGGGRAAGGVGVPPVVLTQPSRPVRGLGPGRGGRHPRRLPRRAGPAS